jgi:hypothetical protein
MKNLFVLTIIFVTAAGFVCPVQACVPVIEWIQDYRLDPIGPISICVLPDGPARTFSASGQEIDAVLQFLVESWTSTPPFPAVMVEYFSGGPEVICGSYVDLLQSDAEGWVTWTPDLQGGGHRGPDEAVYLELGMMGMCPNQLLEVQEDIFFNSPDINGDLKVDLGDIPIFASDYFGSYEYRSDFNWDGVINLSDIPIMAQAVGSACR